MTRRKKTPTEKPRVRYLGDMKRLVLKPGDLFVITTPDEIDTKTRERISDVVNQVLAGHECKCMIFCTPLKVGVIGRGRR